MIMIQFRDRFRLRTVIKYSAVILAVMITVCSCIDRARQTVAVDEEPTIFPDYKDVTIPPNIAPIVFAPVDSTIESAYATFEAAGNAVVVKMKKGQFAIPASAWRKLLRAAVGTTIQVTLEIGRDGSWSRYKPFIINVSSDAIDPYIAYRLIEPGYELWNEMGIYQRHIENFDESPIVRNTHTKYNCMNCHSFCMQNPETMLFHYRESYAGTMLLKNNDIEKLNTKTDKTISPLVYPSWHPSGKFVAFSVNSTKQVFHTTDPNRIEVFDLASDVVVYDVERHEIVTSPLVFSEASFETFPTFSPDGKTLYFCTAEALEMPISSSDVTLKHARMFYHPESALDMPANYKELKYSLCAVSFDPETRRFGTRVDTLYNAKRLKKSVSFPRVSPDGQFLMFTLASYGNFSIWHKDADLYLLALKSGRITALDVLNSSDVESYHSWSSNSRWVVFSSRRIDGLYTRPFFAHIDENGTVSKPFLLPQKDVDFYHRFMKSYNVPEFITGKVKKTSYDFSRKAINDNGIDLKFAGLSN